MTQTEPKTRPLVEEDVEAYLVAHTTAPEEALARLEAETRASLESAQMLSGPVEGRLLEFLVFAASARSVLEIGTFTGYSALSMVRVLPPGGRIVTCEFDEARAAFARRHIEAAGESGRIDLRVGPALETIARLEGPFDLVFIDADKPAYGDYYEAVLPKLSPRGLIVVDNTLWHGEVVRAPESEYGRALAEFNDRIVADERVVCVMLSVRDGITLIRRADARGPG